MAWNNDDNSSKYYIRFKEMTGGSYSHGAEWMTYLGVTNPDDRTWKRCVEEALANPDRFKVWLVKKRLGVEK